MAVKRNIDKIEANDFLVNYLFDYLGKEGYVLLIAYTGGNIPGFSRKNSFRAPESLLKNIARKRLWKVNNAIKYLNMYVGKLTSKYNELSLNEFFYQVNSDEKISKGQRFALFFMCYFEEYMAKKDLIERNIKTNKPPLNQIVTVSLSDQMKAIYSSEKSRLLKDITEILETKQDKNYPNIEIPNNKTLRDILKDASLSNLNDGNYLKLFIHFNDELEEWGLDESSDFMKIVLLDFINLYKRHKGNHTKKIKKVNEELKSKQKRIDEIIDQTSQEIKQFKTKTSKMGEKKDELLKITKTQQKTINHLTSERDKYKHDLQSEQLQNTQMMKQVRTLEKQSIKSDPTLLDGEKIYLFTKVKNKLFNHYFTNEQIVYFNNIDEIQAKILSCSQEAIYFINFDGIPTKESFRIESSFQDKKLTYRIVSNGIKNIVRSIIYYLEGELRHEIKEEN